MTPAPSPPAPAYLVMEPRGGRGRLAMARISADMRMEPGVVDEDTVVFLGLGKAAVEPRQLQARAEAAARALAGAQVVLMIEAPELVWARALEEGASVSEAWQELARSLSQAMAWAEEACKEGLGVCWGVSSEAMVYPLEGARVVDVGWLVGLGRWEHMRVVELPLNLLEPWAASRGVVERAARAGMNVMASRAVSALFAGGLFDLLPTPAPQLPSPGALARALERLEELACQGPGLGAEVVGQWLEELVGPRVWEAKAQAMRRRSTQLGEGQWAREYRAALEQVLEMGMQIQQAAAAALVRRLVKLVGELGVDVRGKGVEELAVGLVGAVDGVWGVVVPQGVVEAMPMVEFPLGFWEVLERKLDSLGSELGRVG